MLPSVDEYVSVVEDTAGPLGLALRGQPDAERAAVRSDAETAFARFRAEARYELPGVALCAAS